MELPVHLRCPHCGGWEVVEVDAHHQLLAASRADPEDGPVCTICELMPWTGLVARPEDEYTLWVDLCEGRVEPPAEPSNQVALLNELAVGIGLLSRLIRLASPEQVRALVEAVESAENALVAGRLADAPLDHAIALVKGAVEPDEWQQELRSAESARREREMARDRLERVVREAQAALGRVGRGDGGARR